MASWRGGFLVAPERLHDDREHRVAVIPGETFGVADGCCLRVAYGSLKEETVVEGVDRLVNGLKAIVRPGRIPTRDG
jgi:aspartate/methionine/tyrosine aminotransferase